MPWIGFSITILTAALAQAAPSSSTETVVPTADDSKLVCKMIKATGSRVRGSRTCMSARDWKQRAKDDQKALTDMQKMGRCSKGVC